METIEARNLNRLRRGKMMLEFTENKKSHIMTFVLALIFASIVAHRFYLGQKIFGIALVLATVMITLTAAKFPESPIINLGRIYLLWLLLEIIIAPILTSHENKKNTEFPYGKI